MHTNTFRETIQNFITQKNSEWIIFGDAHMYDDSISYSDLDFLVNAVNYYKPTSLGLANINISDDQMMYLAPLLYDNKDIRLLYFAFNLIGDKGAEALADLLMKNSGIQELILLRNKIGDKGMMTLAGMLYVNNTLTKMELFDNPFSATACTYFADALKNNHTIKTLLLYPAESGIHISTPQDKQHQDMLRKRNHRMMLLNVNKPAAKEKTTAFRKLISRN